MAGGIGDVPLGIPHKMARVWWEHPLLILDDIDKSRPPESRSEIYWLIFDEGSRAKHPTVLSTNKRGELDRYSMAGLWANGRCWRIGMMGTQA